MPRQKCLHPISIYSVYCMHKIKDIIKITGVAVSRKTVKQKNAIFCL